MLNILKCAFGIMHVVTNAVILGSRQYLLATLPTRAHTIYGKLIMS